MSEVTLRPNGPGKSTCLMFIYTLYHITGQCNNAISIYYFLFHDLHNL